MGSQSADLIDPMSTLERAAEELGAVAAAVWLTEAPRTELTHFWSQLGTCKLCGSEGQQEFPKAFESWSEPIDEGSPLARLFRSRITPDARSFLPFHWGIQGRVVTTVFGSPSRWFLIIVCLRPNRQGFVEPLGIRSHLHCDSFRSTGGRPGRSAVRHSVRR